MKQPTIIRVHAHDMTREGLAKGFERIAMELSLAPQGALFAFEVDGAPWENESVRYWCSRLFLLNKMFAMANIANEGIHEGPILGLGIVGVTVAARALLGALLGQVPHDIRITRGEVWFRGERFMTFTGGAITRPESSFKREVRAFCAVEKIEVLSAARNFENDGCVVEVNHPTDGPTFWVGSWSRTSRYRSRAAIREMLAKKEQG